jgi:hypothetical protein
MPITEHSIRQYYNRLLRSIGIHNKRRKRHELSVHGFGKYFRTKVELAGVKPAVEMLMRHSLGKVSDSYLKLSENELLNEHSKASNALSITAPQKLKLEVKRLQPGISELEDKNHFPMAVVSMSFSMHMKETGCSNGSMTEAEILGLTFSMYHFIGC